MMCAPLSDELRDYLKDELDNTGYCHICHNTRRHDSLGLPCPFCQPQAADKAAKYVVIPGMIACAVVAVVILVIAVASLL